MTGAPRIRVVIVDDVPEARDNVQKLLQFAGDVQVIGQGGTGREAIDLARKLHPDVILMDVSMPEMNGYEAARAIREAEQTTGAHIPIIGVTAHALKGDREKCIEAGMDDYLPKPISPDRLGAKIGTWLSENALAKTA